MLSGGPRCDGRGVSCRELSVFPDTDTGTGRAENRGTYFLLNEKIKYVHIKKAWQLPRVRFRYAQNVADTKLVARALLVKCRRFVSTLGQSVMLSFMYVKFLGYTK